MPNSVRVKICGNQSLPDLDATRCADACGFIVATPQSPRNISPQKAKKLIGQLDPFRTSVVVTGTTKPSALANLTDEIGPDILQIHSNLSPGLVNKIRGTISRGIQLIGLLSISGSEKELIEKSRKLSECPLDAVLMDTETTEKSGGTGTTHNWNLSRSIRDEIFPLPTILAGGLTPENVTRAVMKVKPYAVDVATGVEVDNQISREKVELFLRRIKSYEIEQLP